MERYYTDEINAQIVIALLKEHGIRKVVASPGTTNMAFVVSVQHDSFFTENQPQNIKLTKYRTQLEPTDTYIRRASSPEGAGANH